MYRHFFFDLDKTLTISRSPMAPEHREIFERLCLVRDVIVVTGGTVEHIRAQLTPRFDGKHHLLAQSGNHAIDISGEELWREELNEAQMTAIHSSIKVLEKYFNYAAVDPNDLVENRGAQVGFSVVGYHASVEEKYAFDPDDKKRATALASMPDEVKRLKDVGVEVTPAGTTSFNFIPLGKHKGFNVKRLVDFEKWNTNECVYVGDALFPGGNDESVVGIVPTQPVKNPDDTFRYIVAILEK